MEATWDVALVWWVETIPSFCVSPLAVYKQADKSIYHGFGKTGSLLPTLATFSCTKNMGCYPYDCLMCGRGINDSMCYTKHWNSQKFISCFLHQAPPVCCKYLTRFWSSQIVGSDSSIVVFMEEPIFRVTYLTIFCDITLGHIFKFIMLTLS